MSADSSSALPSTGFFVDWNGDTRRVERPGFGYTATVHRKELDGEPYLALDVIDSEGFVTFEAVYYPSLEALRAVGVTVRLVEDERHAGAQPA